MARPRKPYDQLAFQRPNSRHKGREHERSIRVLPRTQPIVEVESCDFCGSEMSDDNLLATSMQDTGSICVSCTLGAVIFFESKGWNMVPDDIRAQVIAEYLEEQQDTADCG